MNYSTAECGKRLTLLRKAVHDGLSQADVAQSIGVTAQAVCKWEKGKGNIPPDAAFAIADEFHVTLDYLYGKSDSMNPQAEGVTSYTGISPQAAKVLHDLPDNFGADCVEILNDLILSDGFPVMLQRLSYLRKRAAVIENTRPLQQNDEIQHSVQLQKRVDEECGFGVVITGVRALYYEAELVSQAVKKWIVRACGIADAEFAIAEKSKAAHAAEMKQRRRRKNGR